MVKINGIVFVVIGIGISIISYYSNISRNSSKLTLFIYLGIAMAVYGLGKFLIVDLRSREKKPKLPEQFTDKKTNYTSQEGYCHSCGAPLRHYYTYCPRCGGRLR